VNGACIGFLAEAPDAFIVSSLSCSFAEEIMPRHGCKSNIKQTIHAKFVKKADSQPHCTHSVAGQQKTPDACQPAHQSLASAMLQDWSGSNYVAESFRTVGRSSVV
jgi:hypothetical protein